MELKQIFKVYGSICVENMSEEDTDAFFNELEAMMNKHKVFTVEATLNPFKKGVTINHG